MVATESRNGVTVVTLKPHLSADWPQVKRFIALIAVVVFTVAAAWTLAGIWLALPFAFIEVGLIGYLLYRVCFRLSYLHQRIAVERGRVVLHEACAARTGSGFWRARRRTCTWCCRLRRWT